MVRITTSVPLKEESLLARFAVNSSIRNCDCITLKHEMRQKSQRGFSLAEIAVVLLIMGLALGAGLTLLNARMEQAKVDTTIARTDTIRTALVAYVTQNYRLPCPAGPLLAFGATEYSLEQVSGTPGSQICRITSAGGTPTGIKIDVPGITSDMGSRGTVPCLSLGLPAETCVDGWGTRFTYYVQNSTVRLTNNTVSGMTGSMTIHQSTPLINRLPNQTNACSTTINDNTCNSAAVVIIISHGANRGGGYTASSSTQLPATNTFIGTFEIENTNDNLSFIKSEFIKDNTTGKAFDDYIMAISPADALFGLSKAQSELVKPLASVMSDRFTRIRTALLTRMFDPLPVPPQGLSPDRVFGLAIGSGTIKNQNNLLAFQTTYCPSPNIQTLALPLETDVSALSISSGLRDDVWGSPIRYKLHAASGVAKAGNCIANGGPAAHICVPPQSPPNGDRNGLCVTPLILISDGPDRLSNTADDILFPVTYQDIFDFITKYNRW